VVGEGKPQRLLHVYGPTENTTFTTWEEVEEVEEEATTVSIGVPITNTQVYVLDGRMGAVGVGVVGELYLGGAGLARGYLNRPKLTAEKFVPHPYSGKRGERLYRTGDRVRWQAEGKLEFVGRGDGQVKVRGHRIELGEIEAALLGMQEIGEAVVVVREDEPGDKRLVGYVVGREGEEPDVNGIRTALKVKLPEYMVPGLVVVLNEMPLTPNGKIDLRALPVAEATRGASYEAPRTPEEELVAGIWAHVLAVERVGIDENFFELGGHSLLATRVISRIREAFQMEIPLRALFEAPTVRGLAGRIEAARRAGQGLEIPKIVQAQRNEPLPLSYAQQRLWFLDQLDPGSPLYNVYAGYRMNGELDREALEWSIGELVRRHETLRTRFVSEGGAARQVSEEYESFTVKQVDLTRVEEGKRKTELERVLAEETKRPFDLSAGPVFRWSSSIRAAMPR
jgi:acyl carrier protein